MAPITTKVSGLENGISLDSTNKFKDQYMIEQIQAVIDRGDPDAIAKFILDNNLVLDGNEIKHADKNYVNSQIEFWDKRQLVKKINLNS